MKYPSFYAIHGRKPVAGQDYDPDKGLCQDDHEFLSGTGQYSDLVKPDNGLEQPEVTVDKTRFFETYSLLVEETANPDTLHDRVKNQRLRDLLELFEYLRGEENHSPIRDWFKD